MFDPESFLESTVTEALDTRKVPCPIGDYQAEIDKVDARTWKGKDDPTKAGMVLDIAWSIKDPGVLATLDREKVLVRQSVMLDLNASGGLDTGKGKNIGLGRLREATGLNQPGQPFSARMLVGCMALVKVSHRMGDNPEDIFDEIKTVGKIV